MTSTLLIVSSDKKYQVHFKTNLPLGLSTDHRRKWHMLQDLGWNAIIKILETNYLESLNINDEKIVTFTFEIGIRRTVSA